MRRAEREAIEAAVQREESDYTAAVTLDGTARTTEAQYHAGKRDGLKLALREADAARKRSARRARL